MRQELTEQHYFLKNMPLVSANGYAIDVWQASLINNEMTQNDLLKRSTDWVRSKQQDPDCLLRNIESGDLKGVMEAIDAGVSVNHTNLKGKSALALSVSQNKNQSHQITKFLLVRNARVNVSDSTSYKRTPLLAAVKANNLEAVQLLVNENADIDAPDALGRTPLIYACLHNREEIAEYLISKEADIEKCDYSGMTAKLASRGHLKDILKKKSMYDDNEIWSLFGTWGGRDYEEEMF
jgi:ankyrin repeat protein